MADADTYAAQQKALADMRNQARNRQAQSRLQNAAKMDAQQKALQNAAFVKNVQRKVGNGLKVDGIAGPKTHAALGLRFNGQVNMTNNARAGQTYQTVAAKGGEIHQYTNGKRVFVAKGGLQASGTGTATGGSKPKPQSPLHVSGTSGSLAHYSSTGPSDSGPYPAGRTTLPNNVGAIKRFQRFHHLVPDGIVGPKTRRKMRAVNTTLG